MAGRGLRGALPASSRRAAGATSAHRIRIIGGVWKRTPLVVADAPGLRPTPDRVRETLFNWLGQDLRGLNCLDLFAGSGALGFEAASRGAASVVMVELRREPCALIHALVQRLEARMITVLEMDALTALARMSNEVRRFDLVFLDPPFGQAWLDRVWPRLTALLAPGARVYFESEAFLESPPQGFEIERAARAGQVHYHLLRRVSEAQANDTKPQSHEE